MMDREYKDGWRTIIESETFAKGLTEDVVRAISAKKDEPEWLLNFRLKAFKRWLTMYEPRWSDNTYPDFDYQDISYYSAPKKKPELASLDDVDPAMRDTWERLNIPIQEQKRLANVKPVARDLVFDSVSIATTFKKELAEHGVIFMSIGEAVHEYPDLVRKHLGSVVCVLLHAPSSVQHQDTLLFCLSCMVHPFIGRLNKSIVFVLLEAFALLVSSMVSCRRFPQLTITLLPSTQQSSLMDRLSTFPRASTALWSCQHTSGSMLRKQARYAFRSSHSSLIPSHEQVLRSVLTFRETVLCMLLVKTSGTDTTSSGVNIAT